MRSAVARYQHLLTYEQESHEKVIAALEAATPEVMATALFQRALDMMGHLLAARVIWLSRLGYEIERPTTTFPKDVQLDSLRVQADNVNGHWRKFLESLTDDELPRIVDFHTLDGRHMRRKLEDILTQLYGHSFYHRGQIALWLREAGGVPPPTDYIIWCGDAGAA